VDWLHGNVEDGKWVDHVAGWYERPLNDSNVLLVRYEDLQSNGEDTIRRVAIFLELKSDDDKGMDRVKSMTAFAKMKLSDEADPALNLVRWLGVIRKGHIRQGGGASECRQYW